MSSRESAATFLSLYLIKYPSQISQPPYCGPLLSPFLTLFRSVLSANLVTEKLVPAYDVYCFLNPIMLGISHTDQIKSNQIKSNQIKSTELGLP